MPRLPSVVTALIRIASRRSWDDVTLDGLENWLSSSDVECVESEEGVGLPSVVL
jgi:hypothetical protein